MGIMVKGFGRERNQLHCRAHCRDEHTGRLNWKHESESLAMWNGPQQPGPVAGSLLALNGKGSIGRGKVKKYLKSASR